MNTVEKLLGVPMAAPETAHMRRLRFAVIALAATLVIGILMVGPLRALCGPVVTGGILALLLLTTVVIGSIYFTAKSRLDDAWLDQLVSNDRTA